MTTSTYTITIRPLEPKGELLFYQVDARKAKEAKERWDAHQNIQLGDAYISWQRIAEITAPPAPNRLEAPKWCGNCEQGWLFRSSGDADYPNERLAYPCSCNTYAAEEVGRYRAYLQSQSWYTESQRRDSRRRDEQNLYESARSLF